MSKIMIRNSNQEIQTSSVLFEESIIINKYLEVDNIYKLAKMGKKYQFYNFMYGSFNSTLVEEIYKENNAKLISRLPAKLVEFIKNTVQTVSNIVIDEEFKKMGFSFKKSLCFLLVSKKLLKETSILSVLKVFIPFTNMRYLLKYGEEQIKNMLDDIFMFVHKHKYNIRIVLPVTKWDLEICEVKKKAYDIAGLTPPILS